ncbi:MAG: ABC-ATPase domain-containing protein [Leptolyngbya sp. SIO1D8]|nr:ABC-ATPase domain-containing protein [Leptolyngbya sp. SIO1D8]
MLDSPLRAHLEALDGKGYKAYKTLRGKYTFSDFTLYIDHVQGDPFAAPSQLRVIIPQTKAQFPKHLHNPSSRKVALEDFLVRQFHQHARMFSDHRGSGKSGLIAITPPSQAILPRTAAFVSDEIVEIRFAVGLPAFGRRIAGYQAASLLCDDIPQLIHQLLYCHLPPEQVMEHCQCAENAAWLREQLHSSHLVAFIADGAILPRRSGVDDLPLSQEAIPFKSPESLQVSFTLPSGQTVTGTGIPEGITLIVGGGYHGKSTLLQAIAAGVYTHIPGDGREYVVTDAAAMKVRAEDGRSIVGVNISPFISHLPQGKSTQHFSTTDASGSTSEAASIIEVIEAGGKVLLIDEDTSATNFMVRDRRMQALISKDHEPITPFVDKVQQLYTDYGISTILVMGGSGDYFDVADTVIALNNYSPSDVTTQAQTVAATYRTDRQTEGGKHFGSLTPRLVLPQSINPRKGKREVSFKVRATDEIRLGTEEIHLSAIEQLVESGQAKAIAAAIVYAQQHYFNGQRSLSEVLTAVMTDIQTQGLDCLDSRLTGELIAFRRLEFAAAINRLRSLQVLT